MERRQTPPLRLLILFLIASLFLLGMAQAAWSYRLEILGTINTSQLAAEFIIAFTDDNGRIDDPNLDPGDTGECGSPDSSCDPAVIGPGPKERDDQDIGRCTTELESEGTAATVILDQAYPGYTCTAWLTIINSGGLPIRISSLRLNDQPVPTLFDLAVDLNGDGQADVALELKGLEICQQLDPSQRASLQLGQQILAPIPPNAALSYILEVEFQQWNASCESG